MSGVLHMFFVHVLVRVLMLVLGTLVFLLMALRRERLRLDRMPLHQRLLGEDDLTAEQLGLQRLLGRDDRPGVAASALGSLQPSAPGARVVEPPRRVARRVRWLEIRLSLLSLFIFGAWLIAAEGWVRVLGAVWLVYPLFVGRRVIRRRRIG